VSDFKKPVVKLIGEDSNVFNLLGICTTALKRAGFPEKAAELKTKVMNAGSFDNALATMLEYVEEESTAPDPEMICRECGNTFPQSECEETIDPTTGLEARECPQCGGIVEEVEDENDPVDDGDEDEEEEEDEDEEAK
jgi:hypothetical protein